MKQDFSPITAIEHQQAENIAEIVSQRFTPQQATVVVSQVLQCRDGVDVLFNAILDANGEVSRDVVRCVDEILYRLRGWLEDDECLIGSKD